MPSPPLAVEPVTTLATPDLHDLCDATDDAIQAGGGFGWVEVPPRDTLLRYWRGVMAVPERDLIIGRLDGVIAGSAQLVRPPSANEAQRLSAQITTSFVASWARGRGLAALILARAIRCALTHGICVVNLDVRETQDRAIALYEREGFHRWGEHPHYAFVGGRWIRGLFYTKTIADPPAIPGQPVMPRAPYAL